MTFLNPTLAMVGVMSVMIPIIIHILMRRRRRPVPWGAMRFLIEAYRRQRRRMNLEQLLLLAARCLLVLLVGLAVGKPIWGAVTGLTERSPRTVYILLDNSLTASVPSSGRSDDHALDGFKTTAQSMIDALDQSRGDKVAIVALGGPAEGVVSPPSSELAAAKQVVKDLPQTDARADWSGALRMVREDLTRKDVKGGDEVWLVLLSQWRSGSVDLETTLAQLGGVTNNITVVASTPAKESIDNVSIVSVEPGRSIIMTDSGGGGDLSASQVRVVLRRFGPGVSKTAITKVRVVAKLATGSAPSDGGEKAVGNGGSGGGGGNAGVVQTITWAAGQETIPVFISVESPALSKTRTSLEHPPVVITATIDEDAIHGDNTFRRPVELRERLEVGLLAPGNVGVRGGVSDYTAADWFALALSPRGDMTLRRRQTGELRVAPIDPQLGIAPSTTAGGSGRNTGVLTGLDAILIPRPDLLDVQAWHAVKEVYQAGALVIVCPPPGEEAQLWTDEFKSALGLEWEMARDIKSFEPPLGIIPGKAVGEAQDGSRNDGLLSIIAAELPELVRPVTVSRVLPVRAAAGSFDVLLALPDGTPLVLSAGANLEPAPDAPDIKGAKNKIGGANSIPGSRGTVVFIASALDVKWTDLPARPLIVPLLQELVRQGVGRNVSSRSVTAGALPTSLPGGAVDLCPAKLAAEDDVPGGVIGVNAAGVLQRPIRGGSAWMVRSAAGATLGVVAFNADSAAGNTTPHEQQEVAKFLAPLSTKIMWIEEGNIAPQPGAGAGKPGSAADALSQRSTPPPISVPLLIAAGLIALAEALLARFFSHAHRDAFSVGSGVGPVSDSAKRLSTNEKPAEARAA